MTICKHCDDKFTRYDPTISAPEDRCDRCHEEIEAMEYYKPGDNIPLIVALIVGVSLGMLAGIIFW